SFPNFSLPFHVATDASNVSIGAVLYQLIPGQEKKPKWISFIARSLQEHERKYSATKKELLGVVYALKKFQTYLWGNKFTLYTDHRALLFMFTQKNLNPMLTSWFDTLLEYNFLIEHRPGIRNILPDHLLRLFPNDAWTSSYEDPKVPKPVKINKKSNHLHNNKWKKK